MRALTSIAAAALALAACAKASEDGAARRAPNTPPPATVAIPADARLEVTVDGVAAPALDAVRLAAVPAEFADADRRAWRLSQLVPAFDRPGVVIEARGVDGPALALDYPASPTAVVPVLVLTRRGEFVASVIDPAHPFPAYHGQGGQLGRSGDPMPRLTGVRRFQVVTRAAGSAAPAK